MNTTADFHNFGQRVELSVGRDGRSIYKKPRTVFWEWLFFGSDSPLRSALSAPIKAKLNSQSSKAYSIADIVFNLTISQPNDARLGGESIKIRSEESVGSSQIEELINFGGLIAYCFAFGIQDIHFDNVVRKKCHLQVVDAEVVLSNLLLPSESVLLPFRDTPFDRAGIAHLFKKAADISSDDAGWIVAGFVAALQEIRRQSNEIRVALSTALAERQDIPIRVILRDTFKYRKNESETPDKPLIESEIKQLGRGDIPYFFKFLGQNELYYYTSSSGDYEPTDVPNYFKELVSRVGCEPESLLNESRIANELFPTGTLFLLRKLLPDAWIGTMHIGSFCIEITEQQIVLLTQQGSFSSARRRKI